MLQYQVVTVSDTHKEMHMSEDIGCHKFIKVFLYASWIGALERYLWTRLACSHTRVHTLAAYFCPARWLD